MSGYLIIGYVGFVVFHRDDIPSRNSTPMPIHVPIHIHFIQQLKTLLF